MGLIGLMGLMGLMRLMGIVRFTSPISPISPISPTHDSAEAMKRIGILISGRGSNMLALIRAVAEGRIPDAEVAIVISNVANAPGLEKAREHRVETVTLDHRGKTRAEHDRAMAAELRARKDDPVCLARYIRLLSSCFTRQFQ